MASDSELPTWPEIENHARRHLDAACNELSGVRDWLRSDWRPAGSPLPGGKGDAWSEVRRLTRDAEALIDQAKEKLRGGRR